MRRVANLIASDDFRAQEFVRLLARARGKAALLRAIASDEARVTEEREYAERLFGQPKTLAQLADMLGRERDDVSKWTNRTKEQRDRFYAISVDPKGRPLPPAEAGIRQPRCYYYRQFKALACELGLLDEDDP